MIVVDASVVATALVDSGSDGDLARDRLRSDPDLHAPHQIDLEVTSAIRRLAREDRLGVDRAVAALRDLADLRIVRYPHLPFLLRIWELRENLTAYDAMYVALAETLGAVFVTADARLAEAPGPGCSIEVLG